MSAPRRTSHRPCWHRGVVLVAILVALAAGGVAAKPLRNTLTTPNPSGAVETLTTSSTDDVLANPFFQSLGTNGRVCASCHLPDQGWSITPAGVQARFAATGGTDPLFRPVDGATSPAADVSTEAARRNAYSLLLDEGLIRVELPIPAGAEFALVGVDDPYGYAGAAGLSLYRRPLPSTNLRFLSAIMWDGREASLVGQAGDATIGHAQATTGPAAADLQQIVAFEASLYTAQVTDTAAGDLTGLAGKGGKGAKAVPGGGGGPQALAAVPFTPGVSGPSTLYAAWLDLPGTDAQSAARRAIARGEQLFNSISTNPGSARLGQPLCAGCHNTPDVGNHSTPLFVDLGLTSADRRTLPTGQALPVYTLRNTTTGEMVQTTDPGRALVTGKWADIAKFKVPVLRGLAARAPYFHNGSAATLADVVAHYNQHFNLGLTPQQQADLVAFLQTL